MTRKFSGEFSHENYASFFCEVFDSCSRLAAFFHYRLYAGRPAVYVDNLSLTPGQLQYELGQFMFKAVICVGQKTITANNIEKVDVFNFDGLD